MKTVMALAGAALLAATFALPANAAGKKDQAMAQREAVCKKQAAEKHNIFNFFARQAYVDNCMKQQATKKVTGKKAKAA
jgi:hypothetical protein